MAFKDEIEELKSLNLPADQFVIVSSGVLAVRGIREAGDLDVIVSNSLWNEIMQKYPIVDEHGVGRIKLKTDIEILDPRYSIYGNSKIVPIEEIFEKADVFDGIKFMNLEHLKKIKQTLGRDKDLKDLQLIEEYEKNNK